MAQLDPRTREALSLPSVEADDEALGRFLAEVVGLDEPQLPETRVLLAAWLRNVEAMMRQPQPLGKDLAVIRGVGDDWPEEVSDRIRIADDLGVQELDMAAEVIVNHLLRRLAAAGHLQLLST